MYQDEEGTRVVLYVCQNEQQGTNTAFRFAQHEHTSVSYGFDGSFACALAGELDRTTLLGLVETAYQQVVI